MSKLPIVERLETGASMLKQAGFAFRREHEAMSQAATTITELVSALEKCLNFIENTEGELGIALDSGDAARTALSNTRGDTK